MKKHSLLLLGGLMAVAVTAPALAVLLERHAAYRSPFHAPEPEWTPRMQALGDLEEWAAQKAREEAQRAELLKSLNTEKMVSLGKEIVHGKGLCFNCHSIAEIGGGKQGPNLEDVGARAGSRVSGMSDVEYLAQSLYRPNDFVVPGFAPAMTPAHQPPIELGDLEIAMVVAYLQSLGGTPSVGPHTKLPYAGGGAPP